MAKRKDKIENIFASDRGSSKRFSVLLFVMLIFVVGSVMSFVQFSRNRTADAVHNVSEFYLEELVSNVGQVFKTHFDGYFKELRLALIATKEAELQNEEELQEHLESMAERGDFLYYALLDEDGKIYISDDSFASEFMIDFLSEPDHGEEEITIEWTEGTQEDVFIIAVPVDDIVFRGKKIVAGAKGISKDKVKEEILLRKANHETFTHMIMDDGTYVIAGDDKALVESNSYFADLEKTAVYSKGYSLEKMVQDIGQQTNGTSLYSVDGVLYYTHYRLSPRSGWYLIVTLPYDTVSSMMRDASTGVTMGGILLMLLISAVVTFVFYSYYDQKKKSVVLNLAKMEAEERNRAKSNFLSSMSHDIRTPMNAIIGFTNLAIQQDNNERVQDYLFKIRTSSNHLLSLINDILDMSRIESGKMHIEETKCNLADIFHGLHTIIQGQVQAKQQHLYVDVIDVVNEDIWCDKMRLDQLMLNFLSNAVKFTPAGGTISMMVIQKKSARPGYGAYEFRVKDTGIGMTEEFSRKVFEPFERERSSAVNGIQGTGLGMSIAKNIVDMMGGTVRVETELGKGTEFIVNLELRLQEDAEEILPASMEELQGMRALVVDDDFAACDGVIKMLHKFGMDAEWTMSGREAVLRIRQSMELGKSYQLFVVDWQLPDLNGLEVIRQIKTSVEGDVPIILMSSYSWSDVETEAMAVGVTGFCSKPVFMSDLRRLLIEMLSEKEESGQLPEEEQTESFIGKRILLVDDNELNREIAIEILQEYGFEMEAAVDGKEAFEKVRDSEPGYYDVVLMDVQMPIMNGYEASKAIRNLSDPVLARVPIFAMTANAFEEDKQNSLAAGMDGHIAKPIDIDKLLGTLKGILHK